MYWGSKVRKVHTRLDFNVKKVLNILFCFYLISLFVAPGVYATTDTIIDTELDPETGSEPADSDSEQEGESEDEIVSEETKPLYDPDTFSEKVPDPESEIDPESEPESDPEPEEQPESEIDLLTLSANAPDVLSVTTDKLGYSSGDTVTFTSTWSDADGDSAMLLVDDAIDFANCDYTDQTGCIASSTSVAASPATATMTLTSDTNWYAQMCDQDNDCTQFSDYSMDTSIFFSSASFLGEEQYDRAGRTLLPLGDLDGDGYDDFAISGGGNSGAAYIFFGKATGWSMDISTASADASFVTTGSNDNFAYSMAAGDINGDGKNDLILGAKSYSETEKNAGKAYVVITPSNPKTAWTMDMDIETAATASFIGEGKYEFAGTSVASGGSIDGDVYDDILINAKTNDDGGDKAGKVYVFFGKATPDWGTDVSISTSDASFIGEKVQDQIGNSLAFAGDVDNDGYDDIMFTARSNSDGLSGAGETYLVYGDPNAKTTWTNKMDLSTTTVPFSSFIGENEVDRAGWDISSAGDVNNDDYDDILISSHSNDEVANSAGKTYLILGKSTQELLRTQRTQPELRPQRLYTQ